MKTLTTLLVVSTFVGVGCSQKLAFKGGELPTQQAPGCQPGQTTTYKPTKFLFIVDQSGSNATGPYEHPNSPTDPVKAFRFGAINDFFVKHAANPNLDWGFVTFNGSQAQGLIYSGSNQHPTFSSRTAMASALSTFMATADQGNTPYRAALSMAHDMIQQDAAANPGFQYRIALMTDGYPTDYCPDPTAVSCPGQILTGQLSSDVQNILNAVPGAVQLSTVYYGFADANATSLLQLMARVGNGQTVDINVSKTISLDNVISIPIVCN